MIIATIIRPRFTSRVVTTAPSARHPARTLQLAPDRPASVFPATSSHKVAPPPTLGAPHKQPLSLEYAGGGAVLLDLDPDLDGEHHKREDLFVRGQP